MRGSNPVIESHSFSAFKANDIAKLNAAPTARRASTMTENSLSQRDARFVKIKGRLGRTKDGNGES